MRDYLLLHCHRAMAVAFAEALGMQVFLCCGVRSGMSAVLLVWVVLAVAVLVVAMVVGLGVLWCLVILRGI